MGIFDNIKAFTDTVKTTVNVGIDMYHQDEKIEALFSRLGDEYADDLTDKEQSLLKKWQDACSDLEDVDDDDEKKELEAKKDKAALHLLERLTKNDDLDDDFKAECQALLDAKDQNTEAVANLFNQFTDDEETKDKVRDAARKVMRGEDDEEEDDEEEDDEDSDEDEDSEDDSDKDEE